MATTMALHNFTGELADRANRLGDLLAKVVNRRYAFFDKGDVIQVEAIKSIVDEVAESEGPKFRFAEAAVPKSDFLNDNEDELVREIVSTTE